MAIHLKRNENIVWKSHPGKNYRTLILFRDLLLGIFSSVFIYLGLKEFGMESKSALLGISGFIFGLWLLLGVVNQISMILITYVVTNERIIIKRGWLNRKLIDIPLDHIVTTEVRQSFQERVISSGTIYIKTANDVGTDGDKINNIDNPFRLNTLISEVIDEVEEKE